MGAICQTDGFPRAEDTANSGSRAKSRTGQDNLVMLDVELGRHSHMSK